MERSSSLPPQHPLPAAKGPGRAALAAPLRECGEIAVMRLGNAFSDALSEAAQQLLAKGAPFDTSREAALWRQAADFARTRRQAMVEHFLKHFDARYAQSCQRFSVLLASSVRTFDARRLQIVEHEVLDVGLDAYPLAEALRTGTWNSLHELTQWFRIQLDDPELQPIDMPLGPRLIANAFAEAVNDQFGGPEIKQRLLRALLRPLPVSVDLIYRDLAAHLAAPGTVPTNLARSAPAPETPAPSAGERPAVTLPADIGPAETPAGAPSDADRAAAGQLIDPWLTGKRLPGFIAEFLDGPWRTWLGKVHREYGPDSPEWRAALDTLNALLNSLRTRRSSEECARLTAELSGLVKRLDKGLEAAGEPAESRHRFFARLAEYHVRILRAAREAAHPVQPPTTAPAADAQSQESAEAAEAAVQALSVGAWLETRQPFLACRRLKLAWISPNRSLFLLTNHLGERALSLGPKDLADMLRSGAARLIDAPAPGVQDGSADPAAQTRKTA